MSNLLPQGLRFLQIGWWVSHALAIWLIYTYAYRRGRRDERNARLHDPSAANRAPSAGR